MCTKIIEEKQEKSYQHFIVGTSFINHIDDNKAIGSKNKASRAGIAIESHSRHNLRETGVGHNHRRFFGQLSGARRHNTSAHGAVAGTLLAGVARAAIRTNRTTASLVVRVRLSYQIIQHTYIAAESRPVVFWAGTTLPASTCILIF